jgi:hypothetical protein
MCDRCALGKSTSGACWLLRIGLDVSISCRLQFLACTEYARCVRIDGMVGISPESRGLSTLCTAEPEWLEVLEALLS